MKATRILLVDDHAIFRQGLLMVLREAKPDAVISEAGSIEQAMALDIAPPELALLDVKLPGVSGMQGIALIKQRWPTITVVMLSALDAPEAASEAQTNGAAAYVSKAESIDTILAHIDVAMGSGTPTSCCAEPDCGHLTPRQHEVLVLLCQGLSNKLIARQMSLSENTVRRHVQDILEYFHVDSRTEAVFAAQSRGLA
jgi:DNA-binding NarL/FixJ family response regulator